MTVVQCGRKGGGEEGGGCRFYKMPYFHSPDPVHFYSITAIRNTLPYLPWTPIVRISNIQVAAFREKIQSCREMLEKIPGVDTNIEKQKRELEFYQNKYKEKWYSTWRSINHNFYKKLFETTLINSYHFSFSSELLEQYRTLPLFTHTPNMQGC